MKGQDSFSFETNIHSNTYAGYLPTTLVFLLYILIVQILMHHYTQDA